jgi:hypothetical protein
MERVMMEVHPFERRFLQLLRRTRFGIIKELKIEDGLPMLAELVHERVRFDKTAEEK